jgi:hypothetical protein
MYLVNLIEYGYSHWDGLNSFYRLQTLSVANLSRIIPVFLHEPDMNLLTGEVF